MNSTFSEEKKKTEPHIISVEVLGVSFTIRTDENPKYIEALVQELKDRLSKVSSTMRIVDPLKLSLVNSLLVLDELRRKESSEPADAIDFEAESLIDDIDRKLGELGL
jgi:cell division protein ZapA (FtsZ GTPase activity inhibitor)